MSRPPRRSSLSTHLYDAFSCWGARRGWFADAVLEVAGHADATGPEALNRKVSEDRAESVILALKARDFSAEQISVMPKGEAHAYAANGVVEPLNRKATVRLVPVSASRDS